MKRTVSKCCKSSFWVMPNDPITDKIPKVHYICCKCDKPCKTKIIEED